METSVKFVRLVTGEDIIAEVTYVQTSGESYYILNNPMKVIYLASGKSATMSVSLSQWVFWRICDNQDFTLYPKDILLVNSVSSTMEDYYWSSLEHFEEYKEKMMKSQEETSYEEAAEDPEDSDELFKSVIEMLKSNKGTIH